MVDIKNFKSHLLKIDKKDHIKTLIFDESSDHENIHSVNPLYLIIQSATRYFEEKNGKKYVILDSTEKYEEVFHPLNHK